MRAHRGQIGHGAVRARHDAGGTKLLPCSTSPLAATTRRATLLCCAGRPHTARAGPRPSRAHASSQTDVLHFSSSCHTAPRCSALLRSRARTGRACLRRLPASARHARHGHGHPSTPSRRSSQRRPPPTPKSVCSRPNEAPRPGHHLHASLERRRSGIAPPPAAARRGAAATGHPEPSNHHPQVALALLFLLHPSLAASKPPHGRNRRFPFSPASKSRPGILCDS